MYLSQLILNPRSRQVISELADPYQMHRTLSRAFTAKLSDEEGKIALKEARPLFRVERSAAGKVLLLVQSRREPQWEYLERNGYLMENAQFKPYNPQLEPGQILIFRLRANPTKSDPQQRAAKRNRGKRVGLFRETDRCAWLIRKAAHSGFEIPLVGELRGQPVHDFRLTDENAVSATASNGTKATLSAALFDGRLVVRDANVFRAALENGIGPGKAFGFGLLSLRRA